MQQLTSSLKFIIYFPYFLIYIVLKQQEHGFETYFFVVKFVLKPNRGILYLSIYFSLSFYCIWTELYRCYAKYAACSYLFFFFDQSFKFLQPTLENYRRNRRKKKQQQNRVLSYVKHESGIPQKN